MSSSIATHEIAPTSGGILQQLSNEMADAVASGGQATVRVNGRRRLPATGVVWSSDASGSVIVTASHVVERDEDITITTGDGREIVATLVGRDSGSDLAALRIDEALQAVHRVSADETRVGALALALGRAGELSATTGVVSAYGGPWRTGRRRQVERLISTDAPMFPGFSGGPLVDASGRVLGILSSHLGRGQALAVPADEVERIIGSIGQHGRVRRGFLGIGAQPVTLPNGGERGLLLIGIEESGPADSAGLMIGDILLEIDGRPVSELDDLRATLDGDAVGSTRNVALLRGGQRTEISVTIGEQPE